MTHLTANYHTHTSRCGHAVGTEREYVEAAIEGGLSVLGFADHCPWPFKNGFRSAIRMEMKELENYCDVLSALRKEYERDIEIKIGLECEYFPDMLEEQQKYFEDYPVEYLILGHHFIRGEEQGVYVGAPFTDVSIVKEYADDVIAALHTGLYTYLCHPDLPNYMGNSPEYEASMRRICRTAKELNIPLEVNILGFKRKAQYPSSRFFRLAAETGNLTILGVDAHMPEDLANRKLQGDCLKFAKDMGLEPMESCRVKKPVLR